jgi:hypothetical protein
LADLEQIIILVKAWPQPSRKYGETVCCAGVTPEGEWRPLNRVSQIVRDLANARADRWVWRTFRYIQQQISVP